jgi:preprotein translocase subunit SecG
MQLVVNLLTLVLVVVAMFLGLLILLQLPKKEAGITAAFGAESTAALFGAGSGNALSNITKWCAGIFLSLSFLIAILTAQLSHAKTSALRESLKAAGTTPAATVPAAGVPAAPAAATTPAPALALPTNAAPAGK